MKPRPGRPRGSANCAVTIAAKAEARKQGLTRFATGLPCIKGHVAERFVSSGMCIQCDRERYHKNADERIAQMKAWRQQNPEVQREASNRWKRNNHAAVQTHRYKRRSRKALQGDGFTHQEVLRIYRLQGERCANCLCLLDAGEIEADHVMPLALGGAHDISNIQVLCVSCNRRKHKKHPDRWAREQGRLL